jgi:hypothetical protein
MANRTDMTNQIERPELEDVLDAYVAAVEVLSSATLEEWSQKYPYYERELTEFTVAWCQMQSLPPVEHTESDDDEERLLLRGMSVIQNLLHEQSAQPSSAKQEQEETFVGLLAEGRSFGLTIDQLADRVELSAALVRKLDRRLIRYATIPLQLIEGLARVLQCNVITIARYLSGPSTLVLRASYKAEHMPGLAAPQGYFEAVRNDPELNEDRRRHWLSLEQLEG